MGIATLEASKSVARAPGFKALATHLRFGRDVAAWARLSHIFQAPSSAVLDDLARIRKQTETVLADTKDERLAARLRSRIRVIDQMSRTRKNQAAIHANTLGAVEAVAVGINADGSTLKIKLAARTKTNTLVTDLVTQRAAPLQLLGAVTAPPLFFFATHAQPQAVMLAAQMWLGIRGTPLKGLKDVYAKLTQGDFDRDVVPLLSGEVGFAATGRSADLSKAGVHLLLGVKSRADAERVLAKLADSPLVKMMSTKTKAGVRIKVPMPDGRSVHVGVVADAIVATTEPDAFERVGKPGVGFARTLPGSALGPLLGTRTSAALLVSPILRAFASQKERGQRSLIGAPPPASKAPISQDHRDAQKRVTELRTKLATERARAAANRRSARVALAAKMGLLGLVMTRDEHGLVGHGGLFFAAPVKAAVGELAAERARAAQAERIAAATVAAHERELIDAMKQVRKVRLRDIADYELRKQTKPVPKKP